MDLIFYISLFCLILIFSSLDSNIDFDFWARLIVGKTYIQTGSILNYDFYSYGTTIDFIDHEWFSSVIFYLIQNYLGDFGLFFIKSLIIFLTLFLITKIIRLREKTVKFHFLFFFFALHAVSYNIFSTIRCQTFSFFFFVFYLYILEKMRIEKKYRLFYLFPILNIIWQNLHGGYVLGIVLILLYALGEYLNKSEFKYYLYAFLASVLTFFINPFGIKYVNYIFSAFLLDRNYITEWQSAFLNNDYVYLMIKFKIYFILFFILVSFYFLKNCRNLKEIFIKIDKTKILIILFAAIISIKSLRCHPFFVYCVLAFCYLDFYKIFNKKLPDKIDNLKEILLFILILISTISHLYNFKFENQINETQYPIKAVEFIKINHLKGNVFTIFHTGSYVIYKLYPNNQIYMDGRYEEIYSSNLIQNMATFYLNKNYRGFLKSYHTDVIILDNSYKEILNSLKLDNDWFLAFDDKYFSLFLPKSLKNRKFIYPDKSTKQYNLEKFDTNINFYE